MKARILLLASLILSLMPMAHADDPASYSTFIQITSSTKPGRLLVALLVAKRGHKIVPATGAVADSSGSVEKGDGAFFTFLLAPGESRSSQETHPSHKGRIYTSVVSLEGKGTGLWIKYHATIEDKNDRLFDNEGSILASKKALLTP